MASKTIVLGLILSSFPYLRSAKALFPFGKLLHDMASTKLPHRSVVLGSLFTEDISDTKEDQDYQCLFNLLPLYRLVGLILS